MTFAVLGPLEVRADGSLLPLTAAKQKAILATLLLRAGEAVSTDELIETLWSETPPANALTALQGYVLNLRRLLEPEAEGDYRVLVTKSPGYALEIEPEQLDVGRFERLFQEGSELLLAGSAAQAEETLRAALGLWRGAPLADFRYELFAQPAVGRLEEQRLACLEERIEADLALGRHSEVVAELEALQAEHPLRERFAAQLMLALYRSGRQAEALDVYRRTREQLVEDLGIDPGTGLQTLYKAILNQDDALAAADAGVRPRGSSRVPDAARLPVPATPFLGRENELAEVTALLANEGVRLLTLTGAGGTGKTRLALQAAEDASDSFPQGVAWIGLASLRDPALLLPTIGQALGTKEDLVDHIGFDRLLLLIDNFEHVLEAATDVGELLSRCPRLAVMVTSRERLHLSGEQEYPVPPLREVDAVALFHERAHATGTNVEKRNGEILEICRRLDSLPLAIELAAARVKVLRPAALLERLEQRLPLLAAGPRDLPERQQTLRATISWSYDLLAPVEQQLFVRLAIFSGGWTLEAAEEICDADLGVLHSLADKSLVRLSGERFSMLETIREYGIDQLDDPHVRQRHADYFVRFAEQAEEGWFGPERDFWVGQLEAEQGNFRTALSYLESSGDDESLLRLVGGIRYFWAMQGAWVEGRSWVEPALERTRSQRSRVRAKALGAAGNFALPLGDLEAARAFAEESLSLFREVGNPADIGRSLGGLGAKLAGLGQVEQARDRFEEAAVYLRAGGDMFSLALVVGNLGDLALMEHDYVRAEALLEEALALHRELNSEHVVPNALYDLAFFYFQTNRDDEAFSAATESLLMSERIHDPRFRILSLSLLGSLAARQEDLDTATRWLAVAETERVRVGLAFDGTPEGELHDATLKDLRRTLGDERFEAAFEEGRSTEFQDAVAEAADQPSSPGRP